MEMAEPSQRDSTEAPSPAPSATFIQLSLTDEERVGLAAEVERLQLHLVIGKVVGSRPSHGELRDQLQGCLLSEVGKIVDVQALGRGFYQVEFEAAESAAKVLQLSPLSLRGARAHFRPWFHGFNPTVESAPSFIPREK